MAQTYHLVSLGCAKNLVDSEIMLGALERAGFEFSSNPEEAGYLIVNTCGFIQPAVEEAIDEILEMSRLKQDRAEAHLVVVGCLVERYKQKLVEELPEVDIFIGTEAPHRIAEIILQHQGGMKDNKLVLSDRYLMSHETPRLFSTPFYRSWLKITEGCSNHCTYCMIPSIRGPLRSRTVTDLLAEAQMHQKRGVKELSLVAQDSTAFGNDLEPDSENLVNLLDNLLVGTDIPWLRILYLYPSGVTDRLLELMAANGRLLPYLDIPMQHVNTKILRDMNRNYDTDFLYGLVDRIRRYVPDVALRTTFLVGFPGETEEDFLDIAAFLQQTKLDHVGVFAYANEEGSRAEHLPLQVVDDEKERRRDHLLQIQKHISQEKMRSYRGKIEPVIVEGISEETDLLLQGRSRYQAPEIDGCVYINEGRASAGEIVNVEITESKIYDLVGGIV